MARWKVLICIWLTGVVGMAQTPSPPPTPTRDYAVRQQEAVRYSDDGSTATVALTVTNQGGGAVEETQINITQHSDNRVIHSETLLPLAANEKAVFDVPIKLADFSVGDHSFTVEVGIDQYELAGSPIAANNKLLFRIKVTEAMKAAGSQSAVPADSAAYDLWLPLVDVGINILADGIQLNDDRYTLPQILIGLAMVAAGLFLFWLLGLILRLLLYPTPKFGVWHPPYAVNVWHDPDSTAGRRQSWQQHAQNSVIAAPCSPDHVAVLKRLLDMEGFALGGWNIKAIRTVQYDMYGHINRTEVIMSAKLTRRLNKIVRRARQYDHEQLRHALQPVARRLCKAALKPVSKQNRMLPMALDLRFEGKRGEARVVFELHQCRGDAWHLIDQWEPEFGVIGANIPESFTYTLNGLLSGETHKAYKRRLQEDAVRLLGGLLHRHQSDEPLGKPKEEPTLGDLLGSAESTVKDGTPPAVAAQPGDAESDNGRLAAPVD